MNTCAKAARSTSKDGLQTRKWQDKEGHDRYSTEIVANEMQMLDSRGGGDSGDAPPMRQSGGAPRNQARARQRPRATAARSRRYDSSATSDFGDDIDDDIPF